MSLRIDRITEGQVATLRLVGRIRPEHLGELHAQIEKGGPGTVLDLEETTLVGLETVRFLGACEGRGIGIRNASPYIRDWIRRERG